MRAKSHNNPVAALESIDLPLQWAVVPISVELGVFIDNKAMSADRGHLNWFLLKMLLFEDVVAIFTLSIFNDI